MNLEERIQQLEADISKLAEQQLQSRQQLAQLSSELRSLKGTVGGSASGSPANRTPVTAATDPVTMAGASAAAPVQRGLEHFIGLRLIHLAGIIVLLTGISIGIKYA